MKFCSVVASFFLSLTLHAQQQSDTIKTLSGRLKGVRDGSVTSYKGIPYAAPPVGALRWRPPQPFPAWQGVRDATRYGADCAQMGWPGNGSAISKTSSEDCLYLNIWKPGAAGRGSKLPVMVWIHGGGFVAGSGAQQDFSGASFTEKGVILVTINYRLGRLGFFAFPSLSKEYPAEPKGNYAYMDQIAALKWVQANIASFGGNPQNVTIFGESAGGVSVHSLLTIPAASGLFQKAIIESGGGRDGVLTGRPINKDNADSYYPVSAERIGVNFAARHNIKDTDATALAKLRSLPVEEIVDGGQESDGAIPIYSGPVIDGKLVVEAAQHAYEAGRQAAVSLMIGSNSAEVSAGFVNADSKEALLNLFGNLKAAAKVVYDPDGNTAFEKMLTLVNTDKVWAEPARFTARAFTRKGSQVYVYLFSYVSPSAQQWMRYGAGHASEIPYVFNSVRTVNNDKDKGVALLMNTYWTNFAKTGNPNSEAVPHWPVYDPQKNELLEIQSDGSAVGKIYPQQSRLDVIEKAVTSGILH